MFLRRIVVAFTFCCVACAAWNPGANKTHVEVGQQTSQPMGGNVLLLVVDDLGVDKVGAYAAHPNPPRTPNIDSLAARGVLFRNAYAPPSCSPARASILTGRFGRRTGIGRWVRVPANDFEMPLGTLAIPRMLERSGGLDYDHALVGKWHLAGFLSPSNFSHPAAVGFDRYAASAGNLNAGLNPADPPSGYFHWARATDGEVSYCDRYATTVSVDDALAFIEVMSEPWFLMVAFNAAHVPMHVPPASLHSRSSEETENHRGKFDAMVEALDTEIGRLLAGIDSATQEKTTILFVSDNGTPGHGIAPPLDRKRGKETLYEGGTHVPLIAVGPAVTRPGSVSTALVHVVDLFATVADIAGVRTDRLMDPEGNPLAIDGRTLLPYLRDPQLPSWREYVYTEMFGPNGPPPYKRDNRAVRDARWKLIRRNSGPEEFYDLSGRSEEGPDLLKSALDEKAQAAYQRLTTELDRLADELVYQGF